MYKSTIKTKMILRLFATWLTALLIFGLCAARNFHEYNERNFLKNTQTVALNSRDMLAAHLRDPDFSLEHLSELSHSDNDASLTDVEIIDYSGAVIFSSNLDFSSGGSKLSSPEVQAALDKKESLLVRDGETIGERRFYATALLPRERLIIRASCPYLHAQDAFDEFLHGLLPAFVLAALLAGVLSIRLANLFWHPLNILSAAANELSLGKLKHHIDYKGSDEFALLAHALNNLAAELSDKTHELSIEKQEKELLLENTDNAILLTDSRGRVASVNTRFLNIFQRNKKESLIGQYNVEVIGSSALDSTMRKCLQEKKAATVDLRINRQNTPHIFHVFVSPLTGADKGAMCVFHNVTALLGIYERQMKFIASAAHELSTPLTSVRGFAETLLEYKTEKPEPWQKFARIIYDESLLMQRLIKDFLQMARLESAEYRQAISFCSFSAAGLLETVQERLSTQIKHKKLTVLIQYRKPPVQVLANPEWLTQVLLNIAENAIKYSYEAGKIVMAYDQAEGYALFSVADEGIGIKAENQPFVFDKFYRADGSRARNRVSGTGLGLSIAKFIVELFGGNISVESYPNIGSTFTITIPLSQGAETTATPSAARPGVQQTLTDTEF